jgi:hypothetical protein
VRFFYVCRKFSTTQNFILLSQISISLLGGAVCEAD